MRKLREPAGRVDYTWDGRDEFDQVVPEGRYRPRIQLERNGRTIVLPNPIRVDTTPPHITLKHVEPRVFSPDGDRRRDRITATYTIDERARATMLVNGRRRVLGKFPRQRGTLTWFGHFDGEAARPGPLRDPAPGDRPCGQPVGALREPSRCSFATSGSRASGSPPCAGKRFSVRISTDAAAYGWLFAGQRGFGKRQVLVLRAPDTPGQYALYVTVGTHAARAGVDVRAAK